jgi:hypothetical protein
MLMFILFIVFFLLLIIPGLIGVAIMLTKRILPNCGEWEIGKCSGCRKTKPCHIGYGICYPCLVDRDDE